MDGLPNVQSFSCMSDTVITEVELDLPPDEAWEHIIDPSWLGDEGRIIAEPGAEGEVIEDGELRVLVVEEVDAPDRFAFRWATFNEPPSRVEIDIVESDGGSRVVITETPLVPIARALGERCDDQDSLEIGRRLLVTATCR
jgi:uncharacterized protein YndB with AHSA1/START domain